MNWDDVIVDAALTDTGMRRANNQDAFRVVRASNADAWKARGHLFMVADGMGAHAAGELASKLACDNIPHNYSKTKNASEVDALVKAYREVGALIHTKAKANRDFEGMGTTCSTLILLPAGALIAHVGDSRVYRVRDGRIDQLSCDHSLVWELIKRNHLTVEQAGKSVNVPKNVITRSLGPDPSVEVDIEGPLVVEQGDVFVLCSDGLSGPVTDPEIGAFANSFHPKDACRYVLQLANLRGGQDNITVVVVRIGPYVEPGSAEHETTSPASAKREPKGKFFSNWLGSLNRKPAPPPVEEHRYRTAACPLDGLMLAKVYESVRNAQQLAVDSSWHLEWADLTEWRRKADAAIDAGEFRQALLCLGEAVELLGVAGRLHKREVTINTT